MEQTSGSRWGRRVRAWAHFVFSADRLWRFVTYTGQRFIADRCQEKAASLGYVSLLSLVPLLAIGMGVLSAFPAFADIRGDIQMLVFANLMPETGAAVAEQFTSFIENASKATGSGVLAFAIIALLLLNNINGALNEIWRVAGERPLALRFLVYWALLSFGPLLIGASLSLSSYAFAAVDYARSYTWLDSYVAVLVEFARLISITLSTLAFAFLYFVVPNRAVSPSHALTGGLVAALLFELLKVGFGFYISTFASYEAIYGALAAVPVFLVWLYLSWVVVLLGAEVAAALPEWRMALARNHLNPGPGAQLTLALSLLGRLRAASQNGGAMRERALIQGLPALPSEVDATLRRLRRHDILIRSLGGRWALSRDMASLSLRDLARLLSLDPDAGEGWPKAAEGVAGQLAVAGEPLWAASVAELLDQAAEAEEAAAEG